MLNSMMTTAPAVAAARSGTADPGEWTLDRVLSTTVLDNTAAVWLASAGVGLLTWIVLRVAKRVLLSRYERRATGDHLRSIPVHIMQDLRGWFIAAAALFAALSVPVLHPTAWKFVKLVVIAVTALQVLRTGRLVLDDLLAAALSRKVAEDGKPDPSLASASGIIRFMTMLVLGTVLVLVALTNMGLEITPLLTGLGIGGIAVALAVQSVLGDLFASLTIVIDKPFLVGDFIIAGDKMGTVEQIGVKTTRVRALSGEQLVFSNTDLLGSRIQNFKRMRERRAVMTFGIVYETPVEKVERVPAIIRACVEAQAPRVRVDRVHFKGFGAYSLDFEYVYWVLSPEFGVFMDIQQAINLELIRRLSAEGISFAYPTAIEIQRHEAAPPGSREPAAAR